MFVGDFRQDGRRLVGRGVIQDYRLVAPAERDAEAEAGDPAFISTRV
jgi:hypothetical protein